MTPIFLNLHTMSIDLEKAQRWFVKNTYGTNEHNFVIDEEKQCLVARAINGELVFKDKVKHIPYDLIFDYGTVSLYDMASVTELTQLERLPKGIRATKIENIPIKSLAGLTSLIDSKNFTSLYLYDMHELESLDGIQFDNLAFFKLQNCAKLKSLKGLQTKSIYDFSIERCAAFNSFDDAPPSINTLTLEELVSLKGFSGLGKYVKTMRELELKDVPNLNNSFLPLLKLKLVNLDAGFQAKLNANAKKAMQLILNSLHDEVDLAELTEKLHDEGLDEFASF